jgi:hypothetical protein
MQVALDIVSSLFGFLGGAILLISPWKGAPFRRTIDVAEQLDPQGVLFDLAEKDAKIAKAQLANIMLIEPKLIVWGAACLCASFFFALLKHAV